MPLVITRFMSGKSILLGTPTTTRAQIIISKKKNHLLSNNEMPIITSYTFLYIFSFLVSNTFPFVYSLQ
jgi:hypothetical protein